MAASLTEAEKAQLEQTIEMFEVITQTQPQDYQSLEILKEAYFKLGQDDHVLDTSKRIAEAYVQLGQLSSAILEYESIIQRYPDDPDVLKALEDIENRATGLGSPQEEEEVVAPVTSSPKVSPGQQRSSDIDDGRASMEKIFVGGRLMSSTDFGLYWSTPDANPISASEPFIQILEDKGLVPLSKSISVLCERARMGYLPIGKYDVDLDLARGFPKETCMRWCVLPFDRMSKSILVATANPFNLTAVQQLEDAIDSRLIFYMVPPVDLMAAIKNVYR